MVVGFCSEIFPENLESGYSWYSGKFLVRFENYLEFPGIFSHELCTILILRELGYKYLVKYFIFPFQLCFLLVFCGWQVQFDLYRKLSLSRLNILFLERSKCNCKWDYGVEIIHPCLLERIKDWSFNQSSVRFRQLHQIVFGCIKG